MDKIVVRPQRIRQFGATDGATFCFVTNPEVRDRFVVEKSDAYDEYRTFVYSREEEMDELLRSLPEPSHVLVASPNCFFQSPSPEKIGKRKLIAMACNSTPTTLDAIAHFLGIIERTDPERLEAFAQRFFALAEASEYVEIVDPVVETRARLDHLEENYEWNQQAGPLEWGQQQIAPMGEISVLPIFIREFDADLRLALSGEICLRGHPILHSGTPSFLRADQQRIHAELIAMRDHPVIAEVERGAITSVRAGRRGAEPAVAMLERMFDVDSRYRIVWEIGFAINTFLEILPGNHAMNEVYGGSNGCLHWGLGLTPFTQYHLDVICPDIQVVSSRGDLLLGTPREAALA